MLPATSRTTTTAATTDVTPTDRFIKTQWRGRPLRPSCSYRQPALPTSSREIVSGRTKNIYTLYKRRWDSGKAGGQTGALERARDRVRETNKIKTALARIKATGRSRFPQFTTADAKRARAAAASFPFFFFNFSLQRYSGVACTKYKYSILSEETRARLMIKYGARDTVFSIKTQNYRIRFLKKYCNIISTPTRINNIVTIENDDIFCRFQIFQFLFFLFSTWPADSFSNRYYYDDIMQFHKHVYCIAKVNGLEPLTSLTSSHLCAVIFMVCKTRKRTVQHRISDCRDGVRARRPPADTERTTDDGQ